LRHTAANRRGRLATARRWSTSTTSSVSFGPFGELRLMLKHRFLVFHYTSTTCSSTPVRPTAETAGQRPAAHGRSSFLGSWSRVHSDNLIVAALDLRDVPPLPLHIWSQLTHADAARTASSHVAAEHAAMARTTHCWSIRMPHPASSSEALINEPGWTQIILL